MKDQVSQTKKLEKSNKEMKEVIVESNQIMLSMEKQLDSSKSRNDNCGSLASLDELAKKPRSDSNLPPNFQKIQFSLEKEIKKLKKEIEELESQKIKLEELIDDKEEENVKIGLELLHALEKVKLLEMKENSSSYEDLQEKLEEFEYYIDKETDPDLISHKSDKKDQEIYINKFYTTFDKESSVALLETEENKNYEKEVFEDKGEYDRSEALQQKITLKLDKLSLKRSVESFNPVRKFLEPKLKKKSRAHQSIQNLRRIHEKPSPNSDRIFQGRFSKEIPMRNSEYRVESLRSQICHQDEIKELDEIEDLTFPSEEKKKSIKKTFSGAKNLNLTGLANLGEEKFQEHLKVIRNQMEKEESENKTQRSAEDLINEYKLKLESMENEREGFTSERRIRLTQSHVVEGFNFTEKKTEMPQECCGDSGCNVI